MGFLVESPGFLTTVQDLGRYGYQAYGVSPAGAMDRRSPVIANLLAGNGENEGTLEIALGGVSLYFDEANTIAVCGADAPITIDGASAEAYCAIAVKKGQTLRLGIPSRGMRTYIAFSGGLKIKPVMNSLSTHTQSATGGFFGRRLERGDCIGFKRPCAALAHISARRADIESFSAQNELTNVRVVLGPQDRFFTAKGIKTFLSETYKVGGDSNRMGFRLLGPAIELKRGRDMITDGVVLGSIQVPPSGEPIIMMADRQTTGGYHKIAAIITEDMPLAAQCRPGMSIRFHAVTVEQAQALIRKRAALMNELTAALGEGAAALDGTYAVETNRGTFRVTIHAKC